LMKAKQSSEEIDSIINDLKSHIDRLKEEERELSNSLTKLNKELKDLDEKRHQVSTENDVLKGHAAEFEKEKSNAEVENTRCLTEKDKVLGQQGDLMRRLEELKDTQRALELKQKNVEAQLEEFVHENERIRMQILHRDKLA
jgi:chromosome segregation ATPase